MIVKMSSKGQIVIPVEIRNKYGLDEGTEVELEDENGVIKLIPPAKLADLCSTWEIDREEVKKEIDELRANW